MYLTQVRGLSNSNVLAHKVVEVQGNPDNPYDTLLVIQTKIEPGGPNTLLKIWTGVLKTKFGLV